MELVCFLWWDLKVGSTPLCVGQLFTVVPYCSPHAAPRNSLLYTVGSRWFKWCSIARLTLHPAAVSCMGGSRCLKWCRTARLMLCPGALITSFLIATGGVTTTTTSTIILHLYYYYYYYSGAILPAWRCTPELTFGSRFRVSVDGLSWRQHVGSLRPRGEDLKVVWDFSEPRNTWLAFSVVGISRGSFMSLAVAWPFLCTRQNPTDPSLASTRSWGETQKCLIVPA